MPDLVQLVSYLARHLKSPTSRVAAREFGSIEKACEGLITMAEKVVIGNIHEAVADFGTGPRKETLSGHPFARQGACPPGSLPILSWGRLCRVPRSPVLSGLANQPTYRWPAAEPFHRQAEPALNGLDPSSASAFASDA